MKNKRIMKKIYVALLTLFIAFQLQAQDTFSIIALDPVTGEIGSAGASCVTGIGPNGIRDIITDIIPGRGGVNSQALVCIPNVNLQNAIQQMEGGSSPSEIIDWLQNNDACSAQNFNPEYRQYGIVDFDTNGDPRAAGFTGNLTTDYKEDRQGATYSIQGNILLNQTVIDNMEDNFNNTTGTLADKLMAALQGANFPGADSRCLADGTSSTTAYLVVYREDDPPGQPYLNLNVGEQASGIEPIDILQDLYDNFLNLEENILKELIALYPNPTNGILNIDINNKLIGATYNLYNALGKQVQSGSITENNQLLDVSNLDQGIYFITFKTSVGTTTLKFVKQ